MKARLIAPLASLMAVVASCQLSTEGTAFVGDHDAGPPASRASMPSKGSAEDAGSSVTTTTITVDAAVGADAVAPAPGITIPPPDPAPPAPDAAPPAPAPDAAVVVAPPTGPAPNPAPPPPPAGPVILRVHDIKADHITARLVFAHVLEAKSGSVTTTAAPLLDVELALQLGQKDVNGGDLTADIIYAHDIHAMSVDVTEAHVTSVKIGDGKGGMSGPGGGDKGGDAVPPAPPP